MTRPPDDGAAVLRQVAPRVLAVLTWAACLAVAAASLRHGPTLSLLAGTAVPCLLAWALLWRPAVRLDDDGVTLRNIVRDTTIPWAAVEGVEQRWSLAVVTSDGRRHTSWAIGAASPRAGRVMAPHLTGGLAPGEGALSGWGSADVPPQTHQIARAPGTDAATVAALVEAWREGRPEGGGPASGEARRAWSPAGLAALGAAAVLTVLAAV